ncbi:MAG: hypothetical protein WBJ81_06795 [Rickettsiales bacterium]
MEGGNNEEGKILSAVPEKSALKNPNNTKPKRKVNFGDGEYTEKMGPVTLEKEVDFVEQGGQVKKVSVTCIAKNPPEKQNNPKKEKKEGISFKDIERRQAFLQDINFRDELAVTKFLCKFIEGSIKDFTKYIIKIEAHKIDEITAKEEFYNDLFTLASKAKVESGITDEQYNSVISKLYESQYEDKLHKNYSTIIKDKYHRFGGTISEMAEDMAQDVGPTVPEFAQVLSYAKQLNNLDKDLDTLKMTVKVRLAMSDICEYCGLKKLAQSFKDKAMEEEVSKRVGIVEKLRSTSLVQNITEVTTPARTPSANGRHSQGRSNSMDGQ